MESFNHVHYGYGFSWRLSVVGVYQGMEMNRANDLLERALKAYECNDHVGLTDLMEFEIRDYLAQSEVQREALSDDVVADSYFQVQPILGEYLKFKAGFRMAEKMHGIGGGDE